MPDSTAEQLPEIPQYDCGTLGAGHLAELALDLVNHVFGFFQT